MKPRTDVHIRSARYWREIDQATRSLRVPVPVSQSEMVASSMMNRYTKTLARRMLKQDVARVVWGWFNAAAKLKGKL